MLTLRRFATLAVVMWAAISPTASADRGNGALLGAAGASADAGTIDAGAGSTCAIVSGGGIRCWGAAVRGLVGIGAVPGITGDNVGDDPGELPQSLPMVGGRSASGLSMVDGAVCAVLDDGALRCWGAPAAGSGQTSYDVQLFEHRVSTVSMGGTTCVITTDGSLWCGVGTKLPAEPVDLGLGRNAIAVSVGGGHACAIRDDHRLRCWGRNDLGQLGQGNTRNVGTLAGEVTVPVEFDPERQVVAVSASPGDDGATCALLDDGSVHCWGGDQAGRLGPLPPGSDGIAIGDQPGESTVQVDLGTTSDGFPARARSISMGSYFVCATLTTGALRCWGDDILGQLGHGDPSNFGGARSTTDPINLGTGRSVVAVATGDRQTCATFDDRTVKCWGANGSGELGDGTTTAYGRRAGEVPAARPVLALGGELVGRDTDGDGVRDAVDRCPAAAAATANGCPVGTVFTPPPVPGPSPFPFTPPVDPAPLGGGAATPTPQAAPAPVPQSEAVAAPASPTAAAPSVTPAPTPVAPTPPVPAPTPEALLTGKRIALRVVLQLAAGSKHCTSSATASVRVAGRTATARLSVSAITVAGKKRCLAVGKLTLRSTPSPKTTGKVSIRGKALRGRSVQIVRS